MATKTAISRAVFTPKQARKDTRTKLYALIFGSCTSAKLRVNNPMLDPSRTRPKYETAEDQDRLLTSAWALWIDADIPAMPHAWQLELVARINVYLPKDKKVELGFFTERGVK